MKNLFKAATAILIGTTIAVILIMLTNYFSHGSINFIKFLAAQFALGYLFLAAYYIENSQE
jgi:hypothetical protein